MLTEFFNLNRLDRLQRIGRVCQLWGGVTIIGPMWLLFIGPILPASPTPLDSLPSYNLSLLAYRHPVWFAAISAPIGALMVWTGTAFLSRRPWALIALRRLCYAGAAFFVSSGVLWLASVLAGPPLMVAFGAACAVVGGVFAFFFIRLARQLSKPVLLSKFNEATEA